MRILIVKLGSIGDVVHSLPSLAFIHERLPGAKVSWIVEGKSYEILAGNPMLDRIFLLRRTGLKDFFNVANDLRSARMDIAMDFQGLLKSAFVAFLSGAKERVGFSANALREPESRVFLTRQIEIPEKTHVIKKNLLLVKETFKLGSLPDELKFPIFTDEVHKKEANSVIEKVGTDFVVVNPSAGWKTKIWNFERFGALIDRVWEELGLNSVISVARDEYELATKVLRSSWTGKATIAVLSLKGFYELVKKARIYIGGDTGPTHIAVAAGTPVVSIFGPTEWWRNGSPYREDVCLEREDIPCRVNCHRRSCSNWICMNISVEQVFRAVRERLCLGKSKSLVF